MRTGQKWRESGSDTFSSLSRRIKNVPFLEAIVGSSTTDLYDAIFDVELHDVDGLGIFDDDEDDDRAEMRSIASQQQEITVNEEAAVPPFILVPPSAAAPTTPTTAQPLSQAQVQAAPDLSRRTSSLPRTPASPSGRSNRSVRRDAPSPSGSPRPRRVQLPGTIPSSLSGEIQTIGPRSPLSRLIVEELLGCTASSSMAGFSIR